MTATLLMISCQKEVDFENTGTGSGSGGGGGGGSSVCKACSYIPMCDGTVYSYYDTLLTGTPSITADTLSYIKDTTFSGRTYRKFITKGYTTPYYTNCTSGTFRNAVLNVGATGGTIAKLELILLKDDLPVNGTWTDTVTNGLGQTVYYKNKIIAKAVSRTLHTNTFPDVIHVQSENGVDLPFVGYMAVGVSDYYYAKGVGPVEVRVASADGLTVYQHRVIKSYNIP
ncbi:MAG: hypothetical protein NTW29_10015 [Bacteroidetes bacterium]|nr:hypothetical protein [Bacteroidota bacterium]